MQTAKFDLLIHSTGPSGGTVPKKGVTPAEFQLLKYEHFANVGKSIILEDSFELTGEKQVVASRKDVEEPQPDGTVKIVSKVVPRDITDAEELALLRGRYSKKAIDTLFPGSNPKLPKTFSEVGVDDKGVMAVEENRAAIEVISGDTVEVMPAFLSTAPVAPKTSGVSRPRGEVIDAKTDTERRSGSPGDLTFAAGPTKDDGGRAES